MLKPKICLCCTSPVRYSCFNGEGWGMGGTMEEAYRAWEKDTERVKIEQSLLRCFVFSMSLVFGKPNESSEHYLERFKTIDRLSEEESYFLFSMIKGELVK